MYVHTKIFMTHREIKRERKRYAHRDREKKRETEKQKGAGKIDLLIMRKYPTILWRLRYFTKLE